MDISVRLYAILCNYGIENIEGMSSFTPEDIIGWKNIGRRTLEKLLNVMKTYEMKFKGA